MLTSLGVVGLPIGLLGWHRHYFLGMNDSKRKSFFYRNDGQCVFLWRILVEVSSENYDIFFGHWILEKARTLAMERREGLNGMSLEVGMGLFI
jgi:hypothetical protein